jgi:DNA/RNA-binding domain of Phe-tRNA-synthetase-like protein
MHITIAPELKSACPTLALGIVTAEAHVDADDSELWNEITVRTDDVRRSVALDDVAGLAGIKALRQAYRACGKDPARYRGSQEALLRRILKGAGLYKVNTIVDINNLVSIESRHSLGTYDLDRIAGEVTFRIGSAGETYKGIGKDQLNLEGLPVYADANGPFGSPSSDSQRAMITAGSRRIMLVVTAFSGRDGLEETIARAVALLRRFARAEAIETRIVT